MKNSSQKRRSSHTITSRTARPSALKAKRKQYRTAAPLHKRILLHPLSLFVFLCAGVFMAGWTYQVVAATIVSSTVEAPGLTQAATINTPRNQSSTNSSTVTVTGNCPDNSYVSLTINGSYSGTALCDNRTYSITSSLYPGTNNLKVQDYNVTDVTGPTTDPIQVTYNEPASTAQPTGSTTQTKPVSAATPVIQGQAIDAVASAPLLLTSDFHFHTFSSARAFDWVMDLEGGAPPYHVGIEWGDGTSSTLTFPGDPVFHLQHSYGTPGYYPVVVRSVDSVGQIHIIQLAALITHTDGTAPFLNTTSGSGSGQNVTAAGSNSVGKSNLRTNTKLLFLAWPTYLIIVLMTISFWLGEKREFAVAIIRPKNRFHR